MRSAFVSALALGMMLSGAAFAQPQPSTSSATTGSSTATPNAETSAPPANQQTPPAHQPTGSMTADKLKQDLEKAGFTDVKVVAEAFVVQAKTRDGNPVVMTLGPSGFTAFEAVNPHGPGSTAGAPGASGSPGSPGNPAPGASGSPATSPGNPASGGSMPGSSK